MARYGKRIYTLIEFGTEKTGVMYGTRDESGRPLVLAYAERPSSGSIYKGMIHQCNDSLKILGQVLRETDKTLRVRNADRKVFYLLNGPCVKGRQGEGSVVITSPDKKVSAAAVEEAITRARSLPESPELANFAVYDSYFVLDGTTRIKDPRGKLADRLDAYVHILTVEQKRIDQINAMLRELGFEQGGEPVPASIASVDSVLNQEERDLGSLLIDFGAGTCNYVAVSGDGALSSGTVPVGVCNVANDLHVGLDLPYDYCMAFLRESKLSKLRAEGAHYAEYSAPLPARTRKIPLDSFEKIIFARLRETFHFIRSSAESSFPYLGAGCVLTGGGSLLESAREILCDVMGMRVRLGAPDGYTGALSSFRSPPCCYSALFGMLHSALAMEDDSLSVEGRFSDRLTDLFDGLFLNRKPGGLLP